MRLLFLCQSHEFCEREKHICSSFGRMGRWGSIYGDREHWKRQGFDENMRSCDHFESRLPLIV